MSGLTRAARVCTWMFCLTLAGNPERVFGQAPSPAGETAPAGEVHGSGNFSPIVESLERSLEFYQLLGLEVPPAPGPGPRPFSVNPRLHRMLGTTGAKERHVTARIPGIDMGVEPIEFQDIDRRPVRPRVEDPGAVTLVLLVRGLDSMLARLKQSGVPVVTPGGMPVGAANRTRAVLVQDPDGRFVELRQLDPLPETTASAASDIIGARLSVTVEDTDRTRHTYQDLLGFQFQSDQSFSSDKTLLALTGLAGGQIRRSRAQPPGSQLWIEFLEFKGLDRRPLRTRIQDPGSTRLQLRVRNIDAVIKTLEASGATVISTGGQRVALPPNLWGAILRDPNNLFLTLLEGCDGCAPREPPQTPRTP